jgi:thiosulfate dehydrogenase [quinone] large subunit
MKHGRRDCSWTWWALDPPGYPLGCKPTIPSILDYMNFPGFPVIFASPPRGHPHSSQRRTDVVRSYTSQELTDHDLVQATVTATVDLAASPVDGPSAQVEPLILGPIARRTFAVIRVAVGIMWLSNVGWKTPTAFSSLKGFTEAGVKYPVLAPYAWLLKHAVLPNFTLFAWGVLAIECSLAAFLLIGLFTRFFGIIGAAQAAAIGLSVALSPGEWPWSYYLMIMANLALVASAAGRVWGLDALVRPVLRHSPSPLLSRLSRFT